MNKEIIDSLLERAEEMLKGDNSREIGAEEIITIIKEYKKLLKELKCEKELRIRYERRYDKCKESEDRLKFKNTELKKELNYYKEDERNWE